jgi:hypothetical protein
MVILLMTIGAYSIGGYWCLFYWWILVPILLVDIGVYSIGGYWCLFYWWILVAILLMAIGDYFMVIDGYFIG